MTDPQSMPQKSLLSRSILLALATTPLALQAQEQHLLEEIVVTATKRSESIMDVPLAITALTGDFTREANLDDVKDLVGFTPGVTGNSKDSFIDIISVRGIRTNDFGVGGDPSAGFFKNNLYQGRNGAVVTSLYDVERAEILRGPQGFLFGRNTIGGAINVHTVKPDFDRVHGYMELDAAERDRLAFEGAVNLPASDTLGFRLATYYSKEDGYANNVNNPAQDDLVAHEKAALRLSGRYETDRADVNFMLEYEDRDQSGSIYRPVGFGENFDFLEELFGDLNAPSNGVDLDVDESLGNADDAKVFSLGLQIDIDLGWGTLTSITGYKDHEYVYAEDFDGTRVTLNSYSQDQEGDYFEQEFRVVSDDSDGGPLSWYAGASFYKEDIDARFAQQMDEEAYCQYYLSYYGFDSCADYFAYYYYDFNPSPNRLLERNAVRGEFEGYAIYAELNYVFSEQFDVSFGLRYSYDEKEFGLNALPVDSDLGPAFALGFVTNGFLFAKRDWDELTPRIIANYHTANDALIYGSITTGYKSGGFGSFTIAPEVDFGTSEPVQPGESAPGTFEPEEVISYEIGYKGTVLDGRGQLGLNGFFYDYEDLQSLVPGTGGAIIVGNVGQVDGWGFEGTFNTVLNEYLDLAATLAWFDSDATGVQAFCDDTDACEGNPIPWAPEWSGSLVLNGEYPISGGALIGAVELVFESDQHGGWQNIDELEVEGWEDVSVRFGYRSDNHWSVTAYIENLTDDLHYDGLDEGGGILPAIFFGPSRPRTFGVNFSYEFGH